MKKLALLLLSVLSAAQPLRAQHDLTLGLEQTVALANDSSLEAFRARNMYLSSYWQYRSYRANRLPSLTLNLIPVQYNRNITRRYDSEQDIDVYRTQQSLFSYGDLTVKQNFDLTGGTFYLNTELSYMRAFGSNRYTQYNASPLRVGYQQNLVGYNAFRWERKIEPLKYERAKKEYLYNAEGVAEQATSYFFALALAQLEYDMAVEQQATADTLYAIGQERYKIASIGRGDLLTLRLDKVNAANSLQTAVSALKRAMSSLATFLNMDKNTRIRVNLPGSMPNLTIPVDRALTLARENNPLFLQTRQTVLEAEQRVDRTRKESRFNASIDASVGYNQVADRISGAYKHPLQQEMVALSVSIPLIDWGASKGKYNMARNNLNVARISARQQEISLDEDVLMTVSDFNIQQAQVKSAEEALDLSVMAYDETRQRFIIGKTDINALSLARNRQTAARRNYIAALQNYWQYYYKIRKLTLFDFASGFSLSQKFDFQP